jgi:GT2 family glycosyltransferase
MANDTRDAWRHLETGLLLFRTDDSFAAERLITIYSQGEQMLGHPIVDEEELRSGYQQRGKNRRWYQLGRRLGGAAAHQSGARYASKLRLVGVRVSR